MEYQANNKQIKVEMARQFRYSWVQGLHQQLFLDRRPPFRLVGIDVLGAAPKAAFSIASINPVLRFTRLTSPARLSTYAGPTLEAIPDLLDDASKTIQRSMIHSVGPGPKRGHPCFVGGVWDEAHPSHVPCYSCRLNHNMSLEKRDLLKEELACVSA
ncbi:hypothetical protein L3X38_025949 [Prunus dulcis]|uniref:Uncharacterized protein n=1 Tax=Prunus dulcis TaxID=3755 RepID=A0AAD4Z7I9_PRUDU|nr:hypothetical protein L3X38_025949 [Prunus dulcis]